MVGLIYVILSAMTKHTKCVRCKKRMATPISAYCGVCEEIIEEIENADMDKNTKECRRCKAVHNACYIRNRRKTTEVYFTRLNSQHDERIFYLPCITKVTKETGLCEFCSAVL